LSFLFFFQAEDGIRDPLVTGVQTCALPISTVEGELYHVRARVAAGDTEPVSVVVAALGPAMLKVAGTLADGTITSWVGPKTLGEIGRASCRERGWVWVVAGEAPEYRKGGRW